ncbi:hypothetical protein DVH05_007743 [Phytophthora capsici]|nr:hypothetical protein DVH05_007743 [Phytophthora capsici]
MRDYDLFKEIKEFSGVGVCPATGKPMFPDDVWEKLIATKPLKIQRKIAQFRDNGFEHDIICSMIDGV